VKARCGQRVSENWDLSDALALIEAHPDLDHRLRDDERAILDRLP
jgi:hypothetical protein